MNASVISSAECGTLVQDKPAEQTADDGHGFHRRHQPQHFDALNSAAQQQRAQRQAFGKFMDANGEHDGQFDWLAFLQSGCQRQPVHDAMDAQRNHHGGGEFSQPVRRGLVKMACRARRTNVIDVFGDDGEKEVTRSRRRQKPPTQILPTFRRDAAKGDPQQCARAETDEGAKLFMRPRERRAQRPAGQRRCQTPEKSGSKWKPRLCSYLIANRLQFNKRTNCRKFYFGTIQAGQSSQLFASSISAGA